MRHSSFILASASPRRLQLLQQIGLVPGKVIPADIDETPLKGELPIAYVERIAAQKLAVVAAKYPEAMIVAADTIVACGRRILLKAEDEKTARKFLKILSGRRHRVYTSICLQKDGKLRRKLVMTQVRFSRLSDQDIEDYMKTNEWQGKAGAYAIQGHAQKFIPWINGSYSNVVGLPLAEVAAMLVQEK